MSIQRWSLIGACTLAVAVIAMLASSQAQPPSKPGDKPAAAKPPGSGAPAAPSGGAAPMKMPPPLVAVAEAIQQNVAGDHTFVGTIVAKRMSSIGSAVDGRVVEFPMNQGDPVKKGDVLAQLLTGQLDIQLTGAKAQLELEKAALEELKAAWPEEVKQAEARHNSRKAAFDYAASRQQRARSLHKQGTITDEMLHEAESQHDQASQAFAEAKSALAVTQGPRRLAIDQAVHKVAVQQETANAIQDQINKHTIRSPFDGYVVQEFTEVGEWVAKAGMVAKVAELDEVDVEIMVVENYLPSLSLGMNATVEVPALQLDAAEGGSKFTGQIALIVPQADARSRSFPVKVRLKNSLRRDGQLLFKAGMLARVTLPVSSAAAAVLVPKDAVVLGGQTPVVFAVDNPPAAGAASGPNMGMVRRVAVELGVEQNDLIQVKGDIRPGDRVVVQGNERLRSGMPVAVAPPSAAAGGGRR